MKKRNAVKLAKGISRQGENREKIYSYAQCIQEILSESRDTKTGSMLRHG